VKSKQEEGFVEADWKLKGPDNELLSQIVVFVLHWEFKVTDSSNPNNRVKNLIIFIV